MSAVRDAVEVGVALERRDGVARITLDRPPLNILDIAALERLDVVLKDIAADPTVAVLLVTGRGRAFCAGLDVADHMGDRVGPMLDAFHRVIGRLLECEAAVVAAVKGAALGGGCELLLACDVVLATDRAKLGQPEIRLGVFPPAAAALLPERIGRQAALDLILTGRTLTAEEALRLGLVTRVLGADGFEAEVEAYLAGLASLSPPVLRLAKRATVRRSTAAARAALDAAERLYRDDLMRLADSQEGLLAFLEKRDPVWQGR